MILTYIDIIFLLCFAFAAIWGIWKGFVRQLFGIAALFLGVYCAFHFSGFVATYLAHWMKLDETTVAIIAFAVTFLAVLFGVIIAGKIMDKILKIVLLGWLNRITGLLFSLAKMAFILSIFLWLLQALDRIWPLLPHPEIEESIFYAPIAKLAPALFPYLKGLFEAV